MISKKLLPIAESRVWRSASLYPPIHFEKRPLVARYSDPFHGIRYNEFVAYSTESAMYWLDDISSLHMADLDRRTQVLESWVMMNDDRLQHIRAFRFVYMPQIGKEIMASWLL